MEIQGDIHNTGSRNIRVTLWSWDWSSPTPQWCPWNQVWCQHRLCCFPTTAGGQSWCWESFEPGLEQKITHTQLLLVEFCVEVSHSWHCFIWIADMLLLTGCILKRVFWLRRAQGGGCVGLTLVCCLCCLALPAPSVEKTHSHTAQRWRVALLIQINGFIFNTLLNMHDLLCRVVLFNPLALKIYSPPILPD